MSQVSIHTCCIMVYPRDRYGSFNGYPCGATAKIERDGKWYCGRHDPEKVKAREEAREARWAAESDARREKWAKEEEEKRRAAAYPKLLEALRRCEAGLDYEARSLLKELGEL